MNSSLIELDSTASNKDKLNPHIYNSIFSPTKGQIKTLFYGTKA